MPRQKKTKKEILDGGETYLLTHRNWKFQKYISQKIQSNAMQRIEATSADNVLMAVDATVRALAAVALAVAVARRAALTARWPRADRCVDRCPRLPPLPGCPSCCH